MIQVDVRFLLDIASETALRYSLGRRHRASNDFPGIQYYLQSDLKRFA